MMTQGDKVTRGHGDTLSQQSLYEPPAVVYESELEVRAGSPMSLLDPWALPDVEPH